MTMTDGVFPELRDWHATRNALHAYTKVLGAIRAHFSEPHPSWWHGSLLPYTSGLSTTNIPHPSKTDQTFSISLEMRNHYVLYSNSEGFVEQIRISDGIAPKELFDQLAIMMEADGIDPQIEVKFEDLDQHDYSIDKAGKYFLALSRASKILSEIKEKSSLDSSPVQLWPHHFDLSLELFGNKEIMEEGNEGGKPYRSQIGIGFAPFDEQHDNPYFYVNPLPFDKEITKAQLAHGATWHPEGWHGACLPYAKLTNVKNGEQVLAEFLEGAIEIERKLII
jgi:hypothetical protein